METQREADEGADSRKRMLE